MFNQGKISKAQQTEALNAPLPSSNSKKYVDGYTHFVFDELTALSEKYGFKVANDWIKNEWDGHFYLHDAHSSSFISYCFAYDLKDLAEKGLFFIENFKIFLCF